jgi:hypothetical protein
LGNEKPIFMADPRSEDGWVFNHKHPIPSNAG